MQLKPKFHLRWLVTVYSPCALMDRYYHPISVDVKIKVSNKCSIIGEQGCFERLYCCYGNLLCHEDYHNLFTDDWTFV